MKICITAILIMLPLIFDAGTQKKISSEEYIIVFESEDVIIKHHYTVGGGHFSPAMVNKQYSDTSKVYRDLQHYYNKKDSTYIKFN